MRPDRAERETTDDGSVRVWRFGDAVNTDDILPGKYAPFMVGEDVYPSYAFAHLRPEFAAQVEPGDLLVGGRNWGLGSSREYAPRALKELGIGGIVAASFARIHYRNLLNLGIPAFASPEVAAALQDGDSVRFDALRGTVTRGATTFELPPPPDFLKEVLAAGSVLEFYRRHGRLPGETVASTQDAARKST
jgi:methanogen homoaconitase small subunit